MNVNSCLITKKIFLRAFRDCHCSVTDDEMLVADIWWTLHTGIDTSLPCELTENNAVSFGQLAMLEDMLVDLFGKNLEQLKTLIESVCDKKFKDSIFSALISVGLYEAKWFFDVPDSEESHPIFGSAGDEDYEWYVKQHKRSVELAEKLNITVLAGAAPCVYHLNPDVVKSYELDRGRIENPKTGFGDYDPLLTMRKCVYRTKVDYEREKIVICVSDADLLDELVKMVDAKVVSQAKKNIRSRKMALQHDC
ncbi:hypothetical protein [Photobacterium damselae]|uniref:hypothetical protein n=1 Tax=Photobacterium damselae TaxID=38293 RepID=UPI001F319E52|nr:hypothetical protein [Photobacterium damselae]UKA04984.1 hypothetical protein IHC89_22320 [Photobacterium damselae subsp. damselae]